MKESNVSKSIAEHPGGYGAYELEMETDIGESYLGVVRKDHRLSFGTALIMLGFCNSGEKAWKELDRMLRSKANQLMSRQPMIKDQKLHIFGGPNGRDRAILELFDVELKNRKAESV
jgi:hypothetical protein